jgi:TnpA family transposase
VQVKIRIADRRRFLRQLNKGEALHDLRAALMIAKKGQLRQRRGEALTQQALCLKGSIRSF